jgi:DNA-binding SARP family transcriptional activator
VIDYGLLGPVTVREDSWAAELSPQQQLLLAVLVMERGKPVPRQSLIRVLWDEETRVPEAPERGLARAIAVLRARLRAGPGGRLTDDPLPAGGDTYRLVMDPSQADALRFRAQADQARQLSGRPAVALLRAALSEWGPDAAGLFGGQPLSGLRGRWADSTRNELRKDYRDARYECLREDFDDCQYSRVAAECRGLAVEPDALHDEKFLALWMIATYRSGHRTDAERIYQTAANSVQADLGMPPSGFIMRLAEVIRTEDPRLDGPGDQFEVALARPAPVVVSAADGPGTVIAPAYLPEYPAERVRRNDGLIGYGSDQRTPMSDNRPNVTFNNAGNARIGVQAGEVHSPTIHMGRDLDDAPDIATEEGPADETSSPGGDGDSPGGGTGRMRRADAAPRPGPATD